MNNNKKKKGEEAEEETIKKKNNKGHNAHKQIKQHKLRSQASYGSYNIR